MEVLGAGKEAFLVHGDKEEREDDELLCLPPGFRFHPTDEEIIMQYLRQKVIDNEFVARAIGEVDLNKCEPWDLPNKAKMGEKEWWFFCQRDRKYPTGMRTNRATESGYWKATGKDREIFKGKSNCLVGMKKTLVFYRGRAPKGEKSNWVMHEYRLEGQFSYNYSHKTTRDEWVVCRVFHKSTGIRGIPMENDRMDSFVDNLIHSPSTTTLPGLTEFPLDDRPAGTSSTHFLDNHDDHDFKPRLIISSAQVKSPYLPMSYNHYKILHPHNSLVPPEYHVSLSRVSGSPNPGADSIFHPQHVLIPKPTCDSANNALLYSALMGCGGVDAENAVISKQSVNGSTLKVEQYSNNNVSRSQETGLSTEVAATETTSVVSKSKQNADDQSSRPFEDFNGDPADYDGNIDGLDHYSFWDY